MPSGQVIVLNGTSSAGKTTLARALQALAQDPIQLISFDQFRDGLPARYRGLNSPAGTAGAQGLNVVAQHLNGSLKTLIQLGEYGEDVVAGMHQAVATIAATGQHIVVDHFVNSTAVANNLTSTLGKFKPLCVAVHCELEELERREANRPGRFPGTAEGQREAVYSCMDYDLAVDTTHTPAVVVAREILEHLSPLIK